ncbi:MULTISPECIES: hypothetical protein [Rhodomicrobium]|uniref:hypothetical protein n=1 Tax=Rhodomicrobium TaxID=1068 RepID=UPI000B4BED4F|nr:MULTISPECIES: hypothetical protein [Rhodomicrobium]
MTRRGGVARIEAITTGVDFANRLASIEFIEDGKVTFRVVIEPAELDQLIAQLQETRAALGLLS